MPNIFIVIGVILMTPFGLFWVWLHWGVLLLSMDYYEGRASMDSGSAGIILLVLLILDFITGCSILLAGLQYYSL